MNVCDLTCLSEVACVCVMLLWLAAAMQIVLPSTTAEQVTTW